MSFDIFKITVSSHGKAEDGRGSEIIYIISTGEGKWSSSLHLGTKGGEECLSYGVK